MIHPSTELRRVSPEVGYGVFATTLIPRGTITWVRDDFDMVFAEAKVKAMKPIWQVVADRYCFRDAAGDYVICWDFGRYMNHSCEASTAGIGTVCDIALRDIQAGEQLTCEYALHNLQETVDCQCGAPKCRGQIRATDLPEVARALDVRIASALPDMTLRTQVLVPYMRDLESRRLVAVQNGQVPVPSVLENR